MPIDPASLEKTQDAPRRPREHPHHILGRGGREGDEGARGVRWPSVDAVENQRMEVGRQVQGGAEALDERDRAALSIADAEEPSGKDLSSLRKNPSFSARSPRLPA